ncbi:MAG: tRNA glutamyl-Q synthetase [Bacteroidetes bacterium]|nr:MAG: tRNA glutamyl-Q synthetase [Bacteroidota bacterium]
MVRSRLAPTPSGYLHLGNAWNFGLTWLLTRRAGGRLRLRIDDLDAPRVRPEYLEDIFRTLEWLGLDWDEGPGGPEDHRRHFSQQNRHARYRELLQALGPRLFACRCSRREIQAASRDGQYPGTCRELGLPLGGPGTALRVRTEAVTITWDDGWLGPQAVALEASMRDPVLWRKDDIPAYQIATLADDLDHGINLVVRGADLLDSTAIQRWLAREIGAGRFLEAQFFHHPLLKGPDGAKLSKSAGSYSLQAWRAEGRTAAEVWQQLARALGWAGPVGSLQDLLAAPIALPPAGDHAHWPGGA